MRHETAIFGPKNKIMKFQLSYVLPIFCSNNNKKHKQIAETPVFYSVLANLKKGNFEILILNTENWKTKFLHPLKKAIVRKLPDNWAQKTQNDNLVCKKSLETTINRLKKQTWTR